MKVESSKMKDKMLSDLFLLMFLFRLLLYDHTFLRLAYSGLNNSIQPAQVQRLIRVLKLCM